MAAVCETRGTRLREHATFCDECGAPTAVSSTWPSTSRSVPFAEVVRSMDIAAAVDPERQRDIMTELVERSAAVVRRDGGTTEYHVEPAMVNTRIGFGVPGTTFLDGTVTSTADRRSRRSAVAAAVVSQVVGRR